MYTDNDRRQEVVRAGRRIEAFMETLNAEELAQPSACEGWAVGDVAGHLIERGAPIPNQIERGLGGDISAPPDALDDPPVDEDQFRRDLDRRAVALREELGAGLIAEVARVNREFERVLHLVQPGDWDTPCYHRLRPETVRSKIDIRIAELAMHEWDMRWAFDRNAELAEDSLPGLVSASGRAVRRAFRADPSRTDTVGYSFQLTDLAASTVNLTLGPQGATFELRSSDAPDVMFRCAASTYAMVIFGRWKLQDVIANGRLTAEGDASHVESFISAFVGG